MTKSDTAADGRTPSPWDVAVSLVLLTRLPLPALPDATFARQARASWAFPFVGLLIGAIAGGTGWLALKAGLPAAIAAGLVLAAQMVLTGGMHEDGLGDTADGLWGGQTRARRLEIMKDSAIGTYAVLALAITIGLRWLALGVLIPFGITAVITAASLSRAFLPGLMTALPPARSDGLSRSVGTPGWDTAAVALLIGLGIALTASGPHVLLIAMAVLLVVAALAAVARAKIGGQTGDILGAAQQVAELVILLGLVAAL